MSVHDAQPRDVYVNGHGEPYAMKVPVPEAFEEHRVPMRTMMGVT